MQKEIFKEEGTISAALQAFITLISHAKHYITILNITIVLMAAHFTSKGAHRDFIQHQSLIVIPSN